MQMNGKRADSGQTIIESVFMVIFLLILFFLIAEFARAWYLKNSLNNAVRVAVRVAAVTQDLTLPIEGNCNSLSNPITDKVCDATGIPDDERTTVGVFLTEDVDPDNLSSGDTITVEARTDFSGIALGFVLPDFAASSASMRYE
jgi:Flp pilus assembly protein TadG